MNRNMRAVDWFTVGFRLLGVWMLVECIGELVSGLEIQFRLIELSRTTPSAYFLHALIDAVVAVSLLRSKISLFWPDPDPDAPAFEVVLPVDESDSLHAANKV